MRHEYSDINETKNKNILLEIIKAIFKGIFRISTLYTRENLDGTISVNVRLEKNKK